jgi:hypothetical protein
MTPASRASRLRLRRRSLSIVERLAYQSDGSGSAPNGAANTIGVGRGSRRRTRASIGSTYVPQSLLGMADDRCTLGKRTGQWATLDSEMGQKIGIGGSLAAPPLPHHGLGERRKGAAGSTQRPDPPVGRGGFGVRP